MGEGFIHGGGPISHNPHAGYVTLALFTKSPLPAIPCVVRSHNEARPGVAS